MTARPSASPDLDAETVTDLRREVRFLASNRQQVQSFAPVVRRLEAIGHACRLLTLDDWYGQGAEAAAGAAGLPIAGLRRRRGPLATPFYGRSTTKIWRDVLEARRPVGTALGVSVDAMVLGNDSGLLEKLAIDLARARSIPVVLIQDGRLGDLSGTGRGIGSVARDAAKRAASAGLSLMGLGYLGSSRYGAGRADVICASGEHGAQIFRHRSRSPSRIVVTGQPRYDHLASTRHRGDPDGPVVMFTTPFAADGLSTEAQLRQDRFCE